MLVLLILMDDTLDFDVNVFNEVEEIAFLQLKEESFRKFKETPEYQNLVGL